MFLDSHMKIPKEESYTFNTPSEVANFFLKKAWDEDVYITVMKLIKILWFAYGFWLALTGKKLFNETFEAWRYGPVVPSIYHEFKRFGKDPIPEGELSKILDPYSKNWVSAPHISGDIDLEKFLEKIWELYGDFTSRQLVDLTHKSNTPWHKEYVAGLLHKEISDSITKEYFEEEIKRLTA
ncbi:MAG: type II toxin-antitoxin system antitoxin SocA domain-containing protein [Pseudomonadota bacterium]